jgi:hypothetical protein
MDKLTFYLIVGAFAMHGLGMLAVGLSLPKQLQNPKGAFGHSWALRRLGPVPESVAGTVLFGLAGIGYLIAAVGLFLGAAWWPLGAWLGAPLTIVAIALWFGSVPAGTYAGGVLAAVTIAIMVAT